MVDRLSISTNPLTNIAYGGKKVMFMMTPTAKELAIDLNNNSNVDMLEWCAFASVANTDGSASISAAEESALWARLSTDPTTVKQELNTASSKMFGNLQACYEQVTGQSQTDHNFLPFLLMATSPFKQGRQSISLEDWKQDLPPSKTLNTTLFEFIDTNDNNTVDSAEVAAFQAQRQANTSNGMPTFLTMLIAGGNLGSVLDVDNNKTVSNQEIDTFFSDTNKAAAAINATQTKHPTFQELDANGDDSITDKDYSALQKRKSSSLSVAQKVFVDKWKNAKTDFANQDLNNDKKIDFNEAIANNLASLEYAKSHGQVSLMDLVTRKDNKAQKEIRKIATRWLLGSEAKVKPVASGLSEKMKQFLPLLMMMGQNNNPMMSMFMMMMDED